MLSGEETRDMKQCAWRLVTTFTLLALLHSTAMAQSSVSAQPSLQVRRDITRLLVDTLPDHNIDPQRLPGRFQRQVIKRVYEYTALYRRDMQNMLQRVHYLMVLKLVVHEEYSLILLGVNH